MLKKKEKKTIIDSVFNSSNATKFFLANYKENKFNKIETVYRQIRNKQ